MAIIVSTGNGNFSNRVRASRARLGRSDRWHPDRRDGELRLSWDSGVAERDQSRCMRLWELESVTSNDPMIR
eukprot:748441-Hanusia_phi.AAC.2